MKKETKFWLSVGIVITLSVGSQLLGQDVYDAPEEVDRTIQQQEQRDRRADREIIRQELVRNRMKTVQEFKRFEERHKKLHEKDKSISNARLVLSYVLIGAAGYYLGYVSSKEDMKDWGWKKQSKKDNLCYQRINFFNCACSLKQRRYTPSVTRIAVKILVNIIINKIKI